MISHEETKRRVILKSKVNEALKQYEQSHIYVMDVKEKIGILYELFIELNLEIYQESLK